MDLAFFKKSGEHQTVPKGEVITVTRTQESISAIYFLETGIASLMSINEKGEKQTFQYFTKPGFLNSIPYLTRSRLGFENDREIEVIAKSSCDVWKIPVDRFECYRNNPDFLNLLLDNVLQDYIFAMDKQQNGSNGNTLSNLCQFIDQYAQPGDSYRRLNKLFTYAEIASFLQVHEVSVARLMKELKEAGVIVKEGHELVIRDEETLRQWQYIQ
ncbi:Crp/Fnr family transcriptional regulator [Streptococcus moroccensis]|uniref:CRP-like cAMP-binding protein n=1 Tax=Streptococcus moroccensis TaxID=1451356 RepID=A0ABT9YPD1_9STRE|nr:Crp/Fnr family transcriptional regulator [Streptococcus moroccensis]MDQ0221481.1 CRP-like cAMP-binding protein [Streptococcus moroccensis]